MFQAFDHEPYRVHDGILISVLGNRYRTKGLHDVAQLRLIKATATTTTTKNYHHNNSNSCNYHNSYYNYNNENCDF